MISKQANGIYTRIFGAGFCRGQRHNFIALKQYASEAQYKSYSKFFNQEVVPTLDTLDEYVFAPMFGYRDRHEYRAHMAVHDKLDKIGVPCFILNASDDFLIKRDLVPFDRI